MSNARPDHIVLKKLLMGANSKRLLGLLLLFIMGVGMSSCGSDTEKWKEEVLLHDGRKIIVERSQTFGGRHEFGQTPPIREHSVTFTLARSNNPITWQSEYSQDVGYSNFSILALDIINGTAYIVAVPTGCLAYNKWGRPNPPYVVFKYVDEQWKRISLEELPVVIKKPNMLIATYGHADVNLEVKSGFVAASSVNKFNSTLSQEELRDIVRTPINHVDGDCGVMMRIEGGWVSPGRAAAPTTVFSPSSDQK